MEALILVIIIAWAARHALNDAKAAASKSRQAYMARASKRYPHMSSRQASRHAWRHDLGHALSQLLHLFPNARHGFAAGWHEGRQAHATARAGRERAKAEHLETRASLIPEIREYLRRQREAKEEIRRQEAGEGTGGSGEGSSPAGVPDSPEWPARECFHESAPCTDPLTCTCHCAPCLAAYSDRVNAAASHGGGTPFEPVMLTARSRSGRPLNPFSKEPVERIAVWDEADLNRRLAAAAEDPDIEVSTGPLPSVDWDAPLPGDDGHGTTGNPPPDCWLCGLPVDGAELGASAHQRCVEVNDRDMERTEIRDDRAEGLVESDLFAQGKCAEPGPICEGDEFVTYCGQPISSEGGVMCPQHRAEAMGDTERATEEIHRHTRELLAQEEPREEDLSWDRSAEPATEGTTSMSDVTFDGVVRDMAAASAAAETRAAEVNAAMAKAEEQTQEVTAAKRSAEQAADAMQALDMDSVTLGAMADHIDALDAAEQAHQYAQEAYEAARAASVRVEETAQNVSATLQQQQGQLAEAHANTAHAADKQFFGEG